MTYADHRTPMRYEGAGDRGRQCFGSEYRGRDRADESRLYREREEEMTYTSHGTPMSFEDKDDRLYREEEEEMTYTSHGTPMRYEGAGDRMKQYFGSEYRRRDHDDESRLYRKEEEEMTYAIHRTPLRYEGSSDRGRQYFGSEYRGRDRVDETGLYNTQASFRNVTQSRQFQQKHEPRQDPTKQNSSSKLVPAWVKFLVLVVLCVFLYFVIINMESTEGSPLKVLG
ncbi:uncharacterized protein LOC115820870 [Chanos chanos]|uniref:Uncharacterized protein LOC115820870 n=1 Tax=Chanos chanos TaxID=29144 RepID=A0A6J2W915_CHACN|nr:uncharacterized protein LOC115820870 [Chanos chanos]